MVTTTSMAECPRTCECKWKGGKESVICHNANLTLVPPNLDSGTQILDLTDNYIVSLKNQEFSKAGLLNLQKIFLAKCRLKSIEKFAFENLINLVELDLSNNNLNTIPSNSFETIPELRELRLNGNPIQTIYHGAFTNTRQLIKLELSNCRISTIDINSFLDLQDTLEWLKLDNNNLSGVESSVFTILRNLHGLELAGNPWNCTCKIRNLREWMIRQNVPYDIPPTCENPERLSKKSWRILDLDEFACPPKIEATKVKARGIEGNNITLSCNIDGIPTPHVRWLQRNKAIVNLTGPAQANQKKIYIVYQNTNSSELLIPTAEMQDAGTYTCAAENKAGRAEAVVNLVVSKKNTDGRISQKALVLSVLIGIAFTMLCCLLAACLVSARKRRLLKWHNPSECRREDNYEKIEMKQKTCHRNLNGGVTRDREESALVTITKKNGDYSVVPGTDTDHEEEEESTLEITTPGTSNDKKWTNEETSDRDLKIETKPETCRGAAGVEARDNISRAYSLTSGTYKSPTVETASIQATASASAWKSHQSNVNTIYTTASVICQAVPDVIGNSSFTKCVSSRAQSENGSLNNINELFCTLPRKRDLTRYRSTDSQALLLPESRYGSDSSNDSFARRLSVEAQKYSLVTSLARNSTSRQPSGSLLNLSRDDKPVNINSTPLLDVRGLESRLSPPQSQQEPQNPYDYHAAQLEKFLEEYRVLQKQLTKMKETCDSICQEQMRDKSPLSLATNPTSMSNSTNLNSRVNSPNSNSIQDSVDFKNFETELTKYLMSRSPSTAKNFTSGALHNN
ncbi:unnamed protein product [Ceutorhynchus assimilis]|uniref:Ig-like domain-containing protein n=1 Tax=Ceutorhynchus assimilis TaxID=467358 RepID=A0A9N9QLK4_9CUCU|nr:unnamed protein product [Ceutorhynchus assimilis]